MDGWITVGIGLDSKELEKDLKTEKKRLNDFQKENERLNKQKIKAEVDLKPYEDAKWTRKSSYIRKAKHSIRKSKSTIF